MKRTDRSRAHRIIKLYDTRGSHTMSAKTIGAINGVCRATVYNILRNRNRWYDYPARSAVTKEAV